MSDRTCPTSTLLAHDCCCAVAQGSGSTLHVSIGPVTVRVDESILARLHAVMGRALVRIAELEAGTATAGRA